MNGKNKDLKMLWIFKKLLFKLKLIMTNLIKKMNLIKIQHRYVMKNGKK